MSEPTTYVHIDFEGDVPDWVAMRALQLCDRSRLTLEQYALTAFITFTAQHLDD